ncbi:MAG: hypothetical protein KKD44_05095 [Proteobacteria bacterium]|nr:hypothetical protein [Pseudomonadota bacterium]
MDLLNRVLEFLWKNSRFSSYFYQTVRFCEDKTVPTLVLCTWEKRAVLYFNPEFIHAHTRDEIVGLLVHEMLHVIFNHQHRAIRHEHPYLQNLAQDMVINSYIHDRENAFFSLTSNDRSERPKLLMPQGLPAIPADFFKDTGLRDPSWEAVYHWLKTRGPKELEAFNQGLKTLFSKDHQSRPDGSLARSSAEGIPLPSDEAPSFDPMDDTLFVFKDHGDRLLPTGAHMLDHHENRRGLESNLLKAVQLSQKDDTALNDRLFKDISAIITQLRPVEIKPVIRKIKTIVHRFSQSSEWQPSSNKFNRRFFANGIYTPGRSYIHHKAITVAVDVSSSMVTRPESLEKAFDAVESLIKTFRVSLVCLDEALFIPTRNGDHFVSSNTAHASYVYRKGDWKYIRSGNSGTTFFAPLFNRYMKRHKEMLVVITDGQIYDLPMLSPYPKTLWLIPEPGQIPFSPPFGTVLYLEET